MFLNRPPKKEKFDTEKLINLMRTSLAWSEDFLNYVIPEEKRPEKLINLILYSDYTHIGDKEKDMIDFGCVRTINSNFGPAINSKTGDIFIDPAYILDEEYSKRVESNIDVSIAYTIQHEVAHRLQYILGLNNETILTELHADFISGIMLNFINTKEQLFDKSDIEKIPDVFSGIGDDYFDGRFPDTYHKRARTTTHGTGKQRYIAFMLGFNLDKEILIDKVKLLSLIQDPDWLAANISKEIQKTGRNTRL